MTKVFVASVFFMVFYRAFSAFKIWEISRLDDVDMAAVDDPERCGLKESVWRRWGRVFLQFPLDLGLFPILYLSHTVGLKGSSAPQRMLEVLIAVFEAAPEV